MSFAIFQMEGSCPERSSALLVTQVKDDYWAWHFLGRLKPGEKPYSMGCVIRLVKDPGREMSKWCDSFHQAFAQAAQRVLRSPDAPWDVMHNYSEKELCDKFNEAYRSMWQFGIEPGQPPKKLQIEMKKFFSLAEALKKGRGVR